MRYPNDILRLVKQRSKNFDLEGLVEGSGDKEANIMFIGEAPGVNEIKTNVPFSGKSGLILNEKLNDVGLKRENIFISSIVRSRPYNSKNKNRKPNKKEIFAQAPLIDWEIKKVDPRIIVTLGKTSYERITGFSKNLSDCHGKKIITKIVVLDNNYNNYTRSEKEYVVFPFYHPASVFYNSSLKKVIFDDWQNLFRYIQFQV